MNKYKKLVSNTFIFAIGTFSSKLLVFLLLPFYTRVLSNESYGVVDIIVQTCNLLIPIATVGITHAIIRFGLERRMDKQSVFTTGVLIMLGGFLVLLLFEPVMAGIPMIGEYTFYIYLFIFMSSMQGICSQFVRAKGYVRLYAIDGVFKTILTIVFNVLLLGVFHFGVEGYVLATILTDTISTICLTLIARLYRYFNLKKLNAWLTRVMLKYSIPLIPNTICTWIINISDRYMVAFLISSAANGIYAIANKIPTILIIVSNIFGEAWQISAVSEDKRSREQFFTQVSGVYQSIAFLTASFLILSAKFVTRLLASEAFYESWQYIPFLVLATTFACLAAFLSSVYMVEKKTVATMITTFISALVNIVLNLLLIPAIGVNGAAIATFISYFVMFLIRFVHTQSFIRIRWDKLRLVLNFVIILAQAVIMINEVPGWIAYESVLFLLVFVINLKDLLKTVKKVLRR